MRKITCLLFLIALFPCKYSNAQWSLQDPGINDWLFEVYFLNADTGFVLGDYGLVLKTTDGGNNWNPQYTPNTFVYLLCQYFPTKQVGYIGGQDGYVAKTTDGGLNFTDVTAPQPWDNIQSIYFLNKDTGFTASSGIHKTTNGANTWQLVSSSSTKDIFFIDNMLGYAVGPHFSRTTNGGTTWDIIDTLLNINAQSLFFLNKDTGFVATSDPAILKTTDGGLTWNTQTIPISGIGYELHSITFASKERGYAVGGKYGVEGIILYTDDGGNSWSRQLDNIYDQFNSVFFPEDSVGYISSMGGHILKTTNGGLTSVSATPHNSAYLKVSPNPFSVQTVFQINYLLKNATLRLYNSFGQLVKQMDKLSGQTIIFQRGDLPTGLYYALLMEENQIISTEKLIVDDK